MAKHFNIRVQVEVVEDLPTAPSSYSRNDPPKNPGKSVKDLVDFKTQRSSLKSAVTAAIGAVNLAAEDEEG